jgi:hypothetical protein
VGVAILLAWLALFVGIYYVVNKKVFKKNPRVKKSIMTGAKILFVSFQILAALPSIVPAIELPENYKAALSSAQFLNLDLFSMIGVGCFSTGFNLYWSLVGTTMVPLLLCCGLVAMKHGGAAIAVTFLVLPTITTQIFKIFPCDQLDNGDRYLHADYSLSCDTGSHVAFVIYGVLMILVWPVGVLVMYSRLLIANREKIKKPESERSRDEGLAVIRFLFDPYTPGYWWFEVFETARRLAMTGVLSAIDPGSDVQLAVGIVTTFCASMVFVGCTPYAETKDNVLGVLTNAQIFLVMLTALVMKRNGSGGEDERGVGGLLIALNVLCVVVFVAFGVVQAKIYKADFDESKTGEKGLALNVLKSSMSSFGLGRSGRGGSGGTDEGGDDDGDEIEMGENPMLAAAAAEGGAEKSHSKLGFFGRIEKKIIMASYEREYKKKPRAVETRFNRGVSAPPPPPTLPAKPTE